MKVRKIFRRSYGFQLLIYLLRACLSIMLLSMQKILRMIHGLIACNQYQHQLLETLPCDVPIYTLYTPIDAKTYYLEKEKTDRCRF